MTSKMLDKARRAVLKVGGGRGFVVETGGQRMVITAAHCLPHLPPTNNLDPWERTYKTLLGPLGGDATVWTECLFVDPVADLAVLGAPDNQALSEEYFRYEELVAAAVPIRIAEAPENGRAS